jgi:hypothetical protein
MEQISPLMGNYEKQYPFFFEGHSYSTFGIDIIIDTINDFCDIRRKINRFYFHIP